MNGSRNINSDITASIATILGVKGSLRFRPHGSSQKAHVVLRRVISSERRHGETLPENLIQFSLFAAKRIEVKPGKEILLTVASDDDRFKGLPVILEADTSESQSDTDVENETQVAEEDQESYIPLSEMFIPPKLRRDWTKRPEDIIPVPPLPTYLCAGVQVEPELSSVSVQAENQCRSTSTQTEYQNTISSSMQTVNNLISSLVQTECNTTATSVQTVNSSVTSSTQTENNSVARFAQTENNSVSTSMQTEYKLASTSIQKENNATSTSMQTENVLQSCSVQTDIQSVSTSAPTECRTASILVQTESNTKSQLVQSESQFASVEVQVDSLPESHLLYPVKASTPVSMDVQTNEDAISLTERTTETNKLAVKRSISPCFDGEIYLSRPPSPSVSLLAHEAQNKQTPSPEASVGATLNPVSDDLIKSDSFGSVSSSAPYVHDQEPFTDLTAKEGEKATSKINEEQATPQIHVSNDNDVPQSSYVALSTSTVLRKRKSEELHCTTGSRPLTAQKSSTLPIGPRWTSSQRSSSVSSAHNSIPTDEKPSPPPEPRSLAYITTGPSSNPLGIRSSVLTGLNKPPPTGPRAFLQACKPVVVGNKWSATRARGPPKGPTALRSAIMKDGNSQDTSVTSKAPAKVAPCLASATVSIARAESGAIPSLSHEPKRSPNELSSISASVGLASSMSDSDWKRDAPLGESISCLGVPVPIPPFSTPPPPPPTEPESTPSSTPPPPPPKWRKVGKEMPPAPVQRSMASIDVSLSEDKPLHSQQLELPGHQGIPTDYFKQVSVKDNIVETCTDAARSSTPASSNGDSGGDASSKKSRWDVKRAGSKGTDRSEAAYSTPPAERISAATTTPLSSSLPPLPQSLNHPLPQRPPQPMGRHPKNKQCSKRPRQPSPEPTGRHTKRKRGFAWPTILVETSNTVSLQGNGSLAVRSITFSTDGSHFAVTCPDCSLRIWNSKSRTEIARLVRDSLFLSVAWLDNGSGIFALADDGIVGKYTKIGGVWQWMKVLDIGIEDHSDEDPLCFAHTRDRIAVSFPHSGVKVWLWQRGAWCAQRPIARRNVSVIRFVDGGDAIIGGTKDGVLWFCEIPGGTLRALGVWGAKIVSIDVDPSGTHVLVSDSNGIARLLPIRGIASNALTFSHKVRNCTLPALFSKKGQAVLYGNVDECVLVWDRRKAVIVYGLEHSEDKRIRTVACFDGNASCTGFIITGTTQGQLCWWPLPLSDGD